MDVSQQVSWFEFLLDKSLLTSHLNKENPDPSATLLLSQFVLNAEKWKDEVGGSVLEKTSREKTCNGLKKLALQTAAFLSWNLDSLSSIPMSIQKSLFYYSQELEISRLFLDSLYHRWVLRSSQASLKGINIIDEPLMSENVLSILRPNESLVRLDQILQEAKSSNAPITVPLFHSFNENDNGVALEKCAQIPLAHFCSMVHLEIGIYYLYASKIELATQHLQQQDLPTENFPYYQISRQKLDGYLYALNLKHYEREGEDIEPLEPEIVHIAKTLRNGDFEKLKKLLNVDFEIDSKAEEELNNKFNDAEEEESTIVGMEKRLLETFELEEVKELLIKLHSLSGGSRSFSKIFSSWEVPVPIQHGISNLIPGAFQDYIHILVVKSKQLLNLKLYTESSACLELSDRELGLHLQSIPPPVLPSYHFATSKLRKLIEWETLLVHFCQLFGEWPKVGLNLVVRAKECLGTLLVGGGDVVPRAEIIENLLLGLINIGEFEWVSGMERGVQKWPFVEFLVLLAKVCVDLKERKESSSSYRELWHAILPLFLMSNSSSVRRQPVKLGILSSRSMLQWVIERCKSHGLLQLFVSLFARLHNHYTDDMGLQIGADFLHIWPNILDDVSLGGDGKSRASGASKLNSKLIRDILFQLLSSSVSSEKEWLRVRGDVYLAAGNPSLALSNYLSFLALQTDFFEKHSAGEWNETGLFRRIIKCCEGLQAFTQAVVLCQFLTEVDYSLAFGMAQEKVTADGGDALYGFIWDITILEFLINLHTKRNELNKRQQAMKILGLMELNSNNNEEIQREAMHLRKSQFMRTLAKQYIFV